MLELKLTTGDLVDKTSTLSVEVLSTVQDVRISVNGYHVLLKSDDWDSFIHLLENTEGYLHDRLKIIEGPFSPVIRMLTSTPKFQLFLAAVDIAERVSLFAGNKAYSEDRFKKISKLICSFSGSGWLYFIPFEIDPEVTEELLFHNQICRATLGEETRYYIPYLTRQKLDKPLSDKATEILSRLNRKAPCSFGHKDDGGIVKYLFGLLKAKK